LTGKRISLTPRPYGRDWVHYSDIARACRAAYACASREPQAFNVCSGQLTTTHVVASLMEEIVGRKLLAEVPFAGADRYGEAEPGVLPDPAEGLVWRPAVALPAGLARCWAWARSTVGARYLLAAEAAAA
ncbi:MAG TPA: hypothetical protein VFH51_18120, partial [Myxococcota bacterium]|nr:hypothetical protein [Myxococcota bacterium]